MTEASLHKFIFFNLLLLFTLGYLINGKSFASQSKNNIHLFGLSLLLVLFMGLRPVVYGFGDTLNYANYYWAINAFSYQEIKGEYLFNYLMIFFHDLGLSVNLFFLFVEFVYIGCLAWAIKRILPQHAYVVFLVVVSAFSFYGYGVNGLRNGMACSMLLLAISFIKSNRLWALLMVFLSYQAHNSVLLPAVCCLLAMVYKNTKVYLVFWIVCIVVSAVVGDLMGNLYEKIGFLSSTRSVDYFLNKNTDMSRFSNTGFRLDFLLYSSVPIIVGYYNVVKKQFNDGLYSIILNTYIATNAIWVMVNQSWLSNRLAYLSWFMYGVVLVCPLLSTKHPKTRPLRLAIVWNFLFTYIMWLINKI